VCPVNNIPVRSLVDGKCGGSAVRDLNVPHKWCAGCRSLSSPQPDTCHYKVVNGVVSRGLQ